MFLGMELLTANDLILFLNKTNKHKTTTITSTNNFKTMVCLHYWASCVPNDHLVSSACYNNIKRRTLLTNHVTINTIACHFIQDSTYAI